MKFANPVMMSYSLILIWKNTPLCAIFGRKSKKFHQDGGEHPGSMKMPFFVDLWSFQSLFQAMDTIFVTSTFYSIVIYSWIKVFFRELVPKVWFKVFNEGFSESVNLVKIPFFMANISIIRIKTVLGSVHRNMNAMD